jgi:hypothetical protein
LAKPLTPKRRARPRRISFSDLAACHLYEWLVCFWDGDRDLGGCLLCQDLGARLRRFIGPREAARLVRLARAAALKQPGRHVEAQEDRLDVKAARAALKEPGRRIPWAELKKTLARD